MPVVDNTLTVSGAAADARATGLLTTVPYDSTHTYHIGDYVNYNGSLYECISNISIAEVWNADHWGLRRTSEEIKKLFDTLILTGNDLFYSNTKIGLHYIPVTIGVGDKFDIEVKGTSMSVSTVAYYGSNTAIDSFPSLSPNTSSQITATHEANFIRIYTNTDGGSVKITKVNGFGNITLKNNDDIQELFNQTNELYNTKVNISISNSANRFDYSKRLQNKDINSGNGTIRDSNDSYVSDKILIDPTQPLTIKNAFGNYAYCYDDDTYYGRVNCTSGVIISNTYPNTTYIRIIGLNNVTEIMVGYGYNREYIPYNPISNYIIPSEQIVTKNYGDYVNFFNPNTILNNKDINSGTGAIRDDEGSFVSDIIKLDFTETIVISGAYNELAYCYEEDNTYLGRIQCGNGTLITDTYPTVNYIRIIGILPNTNVVVAYGNMAIPYNASEIDGYLKKEPLHLRICQFNMGDFHGKNMSAGSDEMKAAMIELGSFVDANIYGLQYDTEYFGTNLPIYESLLAYKKYYASQFTATYNGKGFLSDYQIYNTKRIPYTNLLNLSHPWFLVSDVRIGNRNIKLITLHVDWQDKDRRYAQLQQIRAYANNYDYCIIIGDFNPDDYVDGVKQSDNLTTEHDLAIFKGDGKFASANAGYWGDYKTIVHSSMEGKMWNGDNILVTTANMEINNSRVVYRDWMDDHAVLYADITIY